MHSTELAVGRRRNIVSIGVGGRLSVAECRTLKSAELIPLPNHPWGVQVQTRSVGVRGGVLVAG